MNTLLVLTIFFSSASILWAISDTGLVPNILDYAASDIEYVPQTLTKPPANTKDSIRYLLYTRGTRNGPPCVLEQSAETFEKCPFDRNLTTIWLAHGFLFKLPPGNIFDIIKNRLLHVGNFNIIIVDWTRYNNNPFALAYENSGLVGIKLGEMMKFMSDELNVTGESFYCIGISLGCNVCGQAGRNTPNLGRITGLDPEGGSKLLHLKPNYRLRRTDATFVDTVHTSDIFNAKGLGCLDPVGHMDFYVNGGTEQPHCVIGQKFKMFKGNIVTIRNRFDKIVCNHVISMTYFLFTIRKNCKSIGIKCDSYSDFLQNNCSSNGDAVTAAMGYPARPIPGLPPHSKFYLNTTMQPPYCNVRT